MAEINNNQLVSYENLKTYILDKIQSNCCNIDAFPDLPDDINPEKSYSKSVGLQKIVFQIIDRENIIKKVTSTTVREQFESFLKSRGLINKPNVPISSKAMLNLFNNITIFIASRIKIYMSLQKTTESGKNETYVFYDDSPNITYDTAPFDFNTDSLKITDSPGQVSKEEARKSVQSLIQQINKTSKISAAELSIRCVCSSSSSCSSSSCSSSCCSSSSSSFIVYMLI